MSQWLYNTLGHYSGQSWRVAGVDKHNLKTAFFLHIPTVNQSGIGSMLFPMVTAVWKRLRFETIKHPKKAVPIKKCELI